jgi:predicted AlkP superfamily pyrophosphatase or phosphodiesterase
VTRGATQVVEKKIFDQMPVEKQNQAIFDRLCQCIDAKTRFYMVNFQAVDGFGEMMGPSSREYLECLEQVDGYLAKLSKMLGSDFIFIITADHGMVDVRENVNVGEELRKEGFRVEALASHRSCHIYTQAPIEELEKFLQSALYIDRVFNADALREWHLIHRRTGDLMVSAADGFEFGEKRLRGSHGGASDKELFVPLIIYDSENEINHNLNLGSVGLVDICPTILDFFSETPKLSFQGRSLLG